MSGDTFLLDRCKVLFIIIHAVNFQKRKSFNWNNQVEWIYLNLLWWWDAKCNDVFSEIKISLGIFIAQMEKTAGQFGWIHGTRISTFVKFQKLLFRDTLKRVSKLLVFSIEMSVFCSLKTWKKLHLLTYFQWFSISYGTKLRIFLKNSFFIQSTHIHNFFYFLCKTKDTILHSQ